MFKKIKEAISAKSAVDEQDELMMDLIHESDESDPLDDHIEQDIDDPEIEKALDKVPEDSGSIEKLESEDYEEAEAVMVDMEELLEESLKTVK